MKDQALLLLDTGNVLNSESYLDYERKYDLVMNVLGIMGYSAINLGAWDLHASSRFVEKSCENSLIPLISANVMGVEKTNSCIQKYMIKEVNGIKIGITGISPQQDELRPPSKRFHIAAPQAALKDILPDLDKKTDFIILLSQFRTKETRKIASNFPNIDLALCVDSLLTDEAIPSGQKVMTIIKRGKKIGVISIEKNQNTVAIKESQIITLDDYIQSDPKIQAMVDDHNLKVTLDREKKKQATELQNQKQILELTPEEFMKQYNNERKKQ